MSRISRTFSAPSSNFVIQYCEDRGRFDKSLMEDPHFRYDPAGKAGSEIRRSRDSTFPLCRAPRCTTLPNANTVCTGQLQLDFSMNVEAYSGAGTPVFPGAQTLLTAVIIMSADNRKTPMSGQATLTEGTVESFLLRRPLFPEVRNHSEHKARGLESKCSRNRLYRSKRGSSVGGPFIQGFAGIQGFARE